MNGSVDFSLVAFGLAVLTLVLSLPLFYLLMQVRCSTPLLGFIIVMLCLGSAVGAFGRLIDVESRDTMDYWIRIIVIATRVAVVGAMLYDIRWLWKRRGGTDG